MTAPPTRVIWIDWLKVLVMLGVFVYHAAQPFVLTIWLISNPERSIAISAFAGLGYLFGMPLIFLLAGAASWFALGRRTAGRYAAVRTQRLALPLVVGIVVLSPFQVWVGAAASGSSESLLAGYRQFFAGMQFYLNPRWLGDYGFHLWFLGFLFLYAIVAIPALVWLRGPRGRTALDSIGPALATRFGLLWLLLPLVVTQVPLRIAFPGYRDWADFGLWFLYFAFGVLVAADRRILEAIAARGFRLLVPGVLVGLVYLPIAASGQLWSLEGAPRFELPAIGYVMMRTTVGWSFVLASIALGVRWLNRGQAIIQRPSELVLPFYVLHHPVVVVVAAVVVGWSVSLWVKFGVIVLVSLVLTVVICDGIVRRSALLRGLFGLPGATRSPAAAGGGI